MPNEERTSDATSDATPGDPTSAGAAAPPPGTDDPALEAEARASAARVGDEVASAAGDVGDRAAKRARSSVHDGKEWLADRVAGVARSIRAAGSELRDDGQRPLADYGDAVAAGIDRTADYLRDRDLGDLVTDARSATRRRPGLVAGGLVAAGLMVTAVIAGGRGEPRAERARSSSRSGSATPPKETKEIQ